MIPFALLLAAPVLFPGHSPFAVWIGLGSLAVALWALWKADEWGGCETTIRADEAKAILAVMNDRRIG